MLGLTDQCDSNPCQNNSICVGGICECLPGYSGENCKEGTFVIIKRINEWENLDLLIMACRILRDVESAHSQKATIVYVLVNE